MNIRLYQSSDREQLLALWADIFGYGGPHNDPDWSLDAKLATDGRILVAEDAGAVLGSVMVGYDGHRGWIYSLCVLPTKRGSGLGKALVQAALAELQGLDCLKVNLQVRSNNHGVVAFYEALGFSVEERISMGIALTGATQPEAVQPLGTAAAS